MVVRTALEQPIHARLAAGDVAGAAEQLFVLYGAEVVGRCRTLARDVVLAQDLAQEAFCRAFTGLAGFRGDASLRTWLFTIVRHVFIDHRRRALRASWRRDDAVLPDERPDESPFLVQLMVDREELGLAFDALDEAERTLVALRFIEGLEYGEIAAHFGLKEGTVRMRLCRALARMRASIDADRRLNRGLRAPAVGRGGPSKIFGRTSRRRAWADVGCEAPASARPVDERVERLPAMRLSLSDPSLCVGADAEAPTRRETLNPYARALGLGLEHEVERPDEDRSLAELRRALRRPFAVLRREAASARGQAGSAGTSLSARPEASRHPRRWLERWRGLFQSD